MTNLRPDLGSCTAELGHSRRPHFRDRLLRLDLVRLAAAQVGPRSVGLAPRLVTGESNIEPKGVRPRLHQHRLGNEQQDCCGPTTE